MKRVVVFLLFAPLLMLGTNSQAQESATRAMGGPGGSPFRLDCGPGAAVVGITGRVGSYLEAIQPICRKLRGKVPEGQAFSPAGAGAGNGALTQAQCPDGAVVGGLTGAWNGRTSFLPGPAGGGNYVNDLSLHCKRWNQAAGGFDLVAMRSIDSQTRGNERLELGDPAGQCRPDSIGSGLIGRAGSLIDAIALICTPAIPDTAAVQRFVVVRCPAAVDTALVLPKGEITWTDTRSRPVRYHSLSVHSDAIHCHYTALRDRGRPEELWTISTPVPAGVRCEADRTVAGQVRCARQLGVPDRPVLAPTDQRIIAPR